MPSKTKKTELTEKQLRDKRLGSPRVALMVSVFWLAFTGVALIDPSMDEKIVVAVWFFSLVIAVAATMQIWHIDEKIMDRKDVDKEWFEVAVSMLLGLVYLALSQLISDEHNPLMLTILGLMFITAAVKACLAVHLSHRPKD